MFKSSEGFKAEKARESRFFKQARRKAEDYVSHPDKLNDLINKASNKAKNKQGPLKAVWQQLMACFRLIKAYANGTYRDVSWSSLAMIIASIIYFVIPVDSIPDFIAGFGFIDDAALLAWTVRTFSSEIEAFIEWESNHSHQ